MFSISLLFYISMVLTIIPSVVTKVVQGHIVTHEKWKFLTRFCFLSLYGTFDYEIEYDSADGYVDLLLYPDLQWFDAYRNPKAKTCEKKMDALIWEKNQVIPLRPDTIGYQNGCERVHKPKFLDPRKNDSDNLTETTHLLCKKSRNFRSARERWWFIAIASCGSKKGLDVHYKFRMTNSRSRDFWYQHFSADEFYILPILTGFCFVYLFIMFSAILFAVELKCRQLLHVTYKLFVASLSFQNLGIFLQCLAYGQYASNGIGWPTVKLLGRMSEMLAELFFILLILLLAKGYTVTRGKLRLASAVKLTVFICTYTVVYGFLFFFEKYLFDPGLVLYIYESPAGYGILILRLVGWLMFVYAIFFTLKHYPEKSSFYLPFFGMYSLWFVSGPVIILISNFVIDKWVREKVALSIEHLVTFIGHVIFLGLTRPSAANKSFPYHVRTTQVGSKESGAQQIERFDSHSYAPSFTDATGRTLDVFTVGGIIPRSENGLNMDVFNATAPPLHMFAAPPPKYEDEFPHERPGQIEEMLRDSDDEENLSDEIPQGLESPGNNNNNNNNNPTAGESNSQQPNGACNGHAVHSAGRRKDVYLCN